MIERISVSIVAMAALAACGSNSTGATATSESPTAQPPYTLAVQPGESDLPHPPLPAKGRLLLSDTNCLALGDKATIIFAPYGSSVSADGTLSINGKSYRLGETLGSDISASVVKPSSVVSPTSVLRDCEPVMVAVLSSN